MVNSTELRYKRALICANQIINDKNKELKESKNTKLKLKIDKKDCLFRDLNIPKGYRIIEDWELLRELRTNKELQEIFKNGIWVNRVIDGEKVIRASWLIYFVNNSNFNALDRGINYNYRVRGVFVKK